MRITFAILRGLSMTARLTETLARQEEEASIAAASWNVDHSGNSLGSRDMQGFVYVRKKMFDCLLFRVKPRYRGGVLFEDNVTRSILVGWIETRLYILFAISIDFTSRIVLVSSVHPKGPFAGLY